MQLFEVECWQRTTYLVHADNPKDAQEAVKDEKRRVGMVGSGEIHGSGIVVRTPKLENISSATPVHQGVRAH